MTTFASMQTLFTEDVARTLSKAGLKPEIIRENIPYIICPNEKSGSLKTILPMNLRARNLAEAESDAHMYNETLAELTLMTGERPLAIPEDRWRSQYTMMRARLLAHLEIFIPVYARNCEIRRIDKHEAAAFLTANHSYGDASCRYRYGMFLKRHTGHIARLFEDISGTTATVHEPVPVSGIHVTQETPITPGMLVAVAEFSNARKWTKGDRTIRSFEWVRYASAAGIRVCGGMGKILRTFISEVSPDDVMSYADIEWSEGSVYEQLGFIPDGEKGAVFFRIDDMTYKRSAIKPGCTAEAATENEPECYFLKNSGSRKYRLKLTDYQ